MISGMAMLAIPTGLAAAAARDDCQELRAWVGRLPEVVRAVVGRWSLACGEPFEPGGQCSWVAPARDAAGRDVVLKVGWGHIDAAHEAAGLRLWNGDGAVLVHAAEAFDDTSTLLLERCVPGTTLRDATPESEHDVVVAQLLRRLWREPPEGHPFRSLQTMCDQWADEFEAKLAADPAALDPGIARVGIELYRSLPASADRSVVLCTDLHAGNILAAEREPWLVIDPKPYVGDPTYDALQHMLNCEERLLADPVGFAYRMADLLEFDAQRLVLWLFARCVQESPGWPSLRPVAARLAPR